MSPDQITSVLSNRLYRNVEAVGVNGGEPTLRHDFQEVLESISGSLPKLRTVHLVTNAIATEQIIKKIDEASRLLQDRDVALEVMVSLDGIGEVHDRVRGHPGNFDSCVQLLDYLRSTNHASRVMVGCTVIRENVFDLENLLDWCKRRDLYARFRVGIPHKRLYSLEVKDPFQLGSEGLHHFAAFLDLLRVEYESSEERRAFYRSLRDQLVYAAPRSAGCLWKNQGVTLDSRGNLAFCAVESDDLGNTLEIDSEDLFWGNRTHLDEIVSNKCSQCTHDYAGIGDRHVLARAAARGLYEKMPPKAQKVALSAANLGKSLRRRRRLAGVVQPRSAPLKESSPLGDRILICGWYGTETLGDKAILGGIAQILQQGGATGIDVASIEPYVTEHTSLQMPELGLGRILGLDDAKTAVDQGRYRAVLLAGGPLMGTIGELVDILELILKAKRKGAYTAVCGCGVGPLGHRDLNHVIRRILLEADDVLLRDSSSKNLAQRELGAEREMRVAPDPAFLWLEARFQRTRPIGSRKRILFALRDWPYHAYGAKLSLARSLEIKRNFEDEIRVLVRKLVEEERAEVIPFCMHKRAVGGDDRFFYRHLLADFPQILENLEDRHLPPSLDLKTFQSCDFVVAMRYHSAVFALASNKPFIAIDYTLGGKVAGLLSDMHRLDLAWSMEDFSGVEAANYIARSTLSSVDMGNTFQATRTELARIIAPALPNHP